MKSSNTTSKIISRLASVFLISCSILLASCQSIKDIVDIGSTIANAGGYINDDQTKRIMDSAEAISTAVQEITPSQEYYIGRSVAATILSKYQVYENPQLQTYLNKICHVLTANSSMPELYNGYSVTVLDTDEINAFSTSGGHILITIGMLKCTSSEDEIAAVLAHEIAHIQLKHGINHIKSNRVTSAFLSTAVSSVMLFSDNDDLKDFLNKYDETVNSLVSDLVDTGYSKDAEYEADEYALKLMNDSGYYPKAMETMLSLLQKNQQPGIGFGKTHPSASNRKGNLRHVFYLYSRAKDTSSFRQDRYVAAMSCIK